MNNELHFNVHEVVCHQGDETTDLLFLTEGKLLICSVQGTEVKVVSRIKPGEFIGELSFFDNQPRSAHVVAIEKSVVLQLSREKITNSLPFWFLETGKNLTKKIRLLDEILRESNYRRASLEEQKPLSIEDQRKILASINNQQL